MPIYEYRCRACQHEFEAVVLPASGPPVCPACGAADLERMVSAFSVSSEGTRQMNLNQARKKAKKTQRDKAIAEQEEILHHHH